MNKLQASVHAAAIAAYILGSGCTYEILLLVSRKDVTLLSLKFIKLAPDFVPPPGFHVPVTQRPA